MIKQLITVSICWALTIPLYALAQDSCSDQESEALKACVEQCKLEHPQCTRTPVTLEEVREALAERCVCENARNFGQYRSCVAQLMNSLRRFKLIDGEIVRQIAADSKECRSEIRGRKPGAKQPKGPKVPKP